MTKDPFEPKNLDQMIEALKVEVQKIMEELLALDPDALQDDHLPDENKKLLQETEELKKNYLDLRSQLDTLVKQQTALNTIQIFETDFPKEPPKDSTSDSQKDIEVKKENKGK